MASPLFDLLGPLAWVFYILLVLGLISVVQSGLTPRQPMKGYDRLIRVGLGGVWLIILLAGMLLRMFSP